MLESYRLSKSTTSKTLISNLQKIQSMFNPLESYPLGFIERMLSTILVKGLPESTHSKLGASSSYKFPKDQHDIEEYQTDAKYFSTLIKLMPQTKTKQLIDSRISLILALLEGARLAEELKWNHKGKYYIDSSLIF